MDEQQIEALLYESEGDELDFKRDQYPLTNNDEKGELIKDILAFVNGWHRTDAYIMIGVNQAKVAGRSTPHGVSSHLADSNLQQMVNSKTNQPVKFAYEETSFKGVDIGIIKIPVQDRPRFLTKDFGGLKKDIVYVRRGSSTAEAGLDEILQMKAGPNTPSLELQFAYARAWKPLGKQITAVSQIVEYDINILPRLNAGSPFQMVMSNVNVNYPTEMAKYIAETGLLYPFGFCVTNSATSLAENIRLEIKLTKNDELRIADEWDLPRRPQQEGRLFEMPRVIQSNAQVETFLNQALIKVKFGNIQPGQTVWSDGKIYIGSTMPTDIVLNGLLYGDNLPTPAPVRLKIEIQTKHRKLDFNELNLKK